MVVRVLGQIRVEPHHRVVEHGIVNLARNDRAQAQVNTIVDCEGAVTIMPGTLFVNLRGAVCATHALLLAILVDAPQVVHTVTYSLLVAELAKEVRGHRKESDILDL